MLKKHCKKNLFTVFPNLLISVSRVVTISGAITLEMETSKNPTNEELDLKNEQLDGMTEPQVRKA